MNYIRLMLILTMSVSMYPEAYENMITGIQLIPGATKKTMIMTFQKSNPVVTYAPQSYQQSNNSGQECCFYLPNTQIAPNVAMNEYVTFKRSGVTIIIPVVQRQMHVGKKIVFIMPGQ